MDNTNSHRHLALYHSKDLDGLCSAAIVKYSLGEYVDLYPFDYGNRIPWELFNHNRVVYLLDCSFSKEDMLKANKLTNLIWVDHHTGIINQLIGTHIKGLQRIGTAACELTWEYFQKYRESQAVPMGVRLLSQYDVGILDPENRIINYQLGIKILNLDPNDTAAWVNNVFRNEIVPYHAKQGDIIRRYLNQVNKGIVNNNAFTLVWEGHTTLAINSTTNSSILFKDHPKYGLTDLLMVFQLIDKKWHFSIYTTKNYIDCSNIALKYGGGGHVKAAGFLLEELPNELL